MLQGIEKNPRSRLEHETIEELRLRAPGLSLNDRSHIDTLFRGGVIFSKFDSREQEQIQQNLYDLSHLIIDLSCLVQDWKVMCPAAKCVAQLAECNAVDLMRGRSLTALSPMLAFALDHVESVDPGVILYAPRKDPISHVWSRLAYHAREQGWRSRVIETYTDKLTNNKVEDSTTAEIPTGEEQLEDEPLKLREGRPDEKWIERRRQWRQAGSFCPPMVLGPNTVRESKIRAFLKQGFEPGWATSATSLPQEPCYPRSDRQIASKNEDPGLVAIESDPHPCAYPPTVPTRFDYLPMALTPWHDEFSNNLVSDEVAPSLITGDIVWPTHQLQYSETQVRANNLEDKWGSIKAASSSISTVDTVASLSDSVYSISEVWPDSETTERPPQLPVSQAFSDSIAVYVLEDGAWKQDPSIPRREWPGSLLDKYNNGLVFYDHSDMRTQTLSQYDHPSCIFVRGSGSVCDIDESLRAEATLLYSKH